MEQGALSSTVGTVMEACGLQAVPAADGEAGGTA